MSYNELYEWYEYYNEEPFLSDKIEIQLATLSQIASSFGGGKLKHNDFMISGKNKKDSEDVDIGNKIKAMFGIN